jgi:hypothetical protein
MSGISGMSGMSGMSKIVIAENRHQGWQIFYLDEIAHRKKLRTGNPNNPPKACVRLPRALHFKGEVHNAISYDDSILKEEWVGGGLRVKNFWVICACFWSDCGVVIL